MRRVLRFALALGLAGCSPPAPDNVAPAAAPGPFAAPTNLRAKLADPLNIDLTWKDNATNEGGYFVEGYYVSHAPSSQEFAVIEALPPDTTSYKHTKLLPETRFLYRVRPFFGRTSNAAEIVTGKKGTPQVTGPEAGGRRADGAEIRASLRSIESEAMAAPTDLRATLLPPAGVTLEWKDHAGNEDQYLVEVRSPGSEEFKPAAFEAADTTTWTSNDFDLESRFEFRVRAFVYGEASNVVEQTTGTDPSMAPGQWQPSR